jgi:CheY-like chemotaxis protein
MKKRILIFDDDKDILQLSTTIFNKNGYEVATEEDCNLMLEAVCNYNPDIIICDHQMPGLNGADAIRQLKSNDLYKNIPIVYFSSVNDIAVEAERIHADAWLQKPASIDALLTVVRSLVYPI